MLEFLIVLDVLLAVAIISAVFFHKGPDGFMGDATPTNANTNGPRFETFDKIIACIVIAFFAVTLSINYNKPIGNGIITALNKKQAYERCGKIKSIKNNKGYEAAKAVLSILDNGTKKI